MKLSEIQALSQQIHDKAAAFEAVAKEIRERLEKGKERERKLDNALQAGREGKAYVESQ